MTAQVAPLTLQQVDSEDDESDTEDIFGSTEKVQTRQAIEAVDVLLNF